MKLTQDEKQARAEARKQAKIASKNQAIIDAQKAQPDVKELTINIEWTKSRTWGSNPNAVAQGHTVNGDFFRIGPFSCSGCGYDKESTVIADVFNACMCGMLHKVETFDGKTYGVREYEGKRYFEGGIGTSCYFAISELIGGTFEQISSGKMFDVYRFTKNLNE